MGFLWPPTEIHEYFFFRLVKKLDDKLCNKWGNGRFVCFFSQILFYE